jgi:D-methionine transport system substrate-binding protein
MRKTTLWGIFFLLFTISSAFVFPFSKKNKEKIVLKIGVLSSRDEEIIRFIKENYKDEDFELEISVYAYSMQSNSDLMEDLIDCNYSQNKNSLKAYNMENHTDIKSYGEAYFEKMGIYSKKNKSIKEFNNVVIAVPNIENDRIRSLEILQETGLIKLDEEYQIIENPRNISIIEISPKYLSRVINQVDGVVSNENFSGNTLYLENYNKKYINVLAAKKSNKRKDELKRLAELLKSAETKNFIRKKYKNIIID